MRKEIIMLEVHGDEENDIIDDYNRRMQIARYWAFWIRVRLWIEWNRGKIILLSAFILIMINACLVTKIL